jgi:predicted Ser/Thr protein kinase
MEDYVGKTLGRYQLTSLLGEGGMGGVFRAQDTVLTREVAIKIMNPQMALQPNFKDRFLQEARSAARLKHANIVQVYDFAQDGDTLYIVMEYIPGKNLGQYLEELRSKGEWLSYLDSIEIARQVALALDCAHKAGVLHRDIKPANIIMAPVADEAFPYRPVLTDLGLAKLAEGGIVTQVGISLGTPAYMAPEQALGKATDARCDLYSLGVLLFQMATRQLPYPAKTISEAILYHAKKQPPTPRSVRADIPEALEGVILKSMEKDPANRYADAASMAKALEELKAQIRPPDQLPVAEVGMMTQVEPGAVDGRGLSILEDFSASAQGVRDRIQILSQGKTGYSIPLKMGKMVIGRARENDITLDDTKISRQHARIEYDGKDVRVVDLDSTNGTFIADAKLLPGVPELWTPDKVLRVGDVYLHLERAAAVQPAPVHTTIGITPPIPQGRAQAAPGGRIAATVAQPVVSVNPGEIAQLVILLVNQGMLVEHITLSVEGIPASWIQTPMPVIQLMPGDQREMNIPIQPARSPQSRAGVYPLVIHILTKEPGGNTDAEVKLEVGPYSQFASELAPQKIRAGRLARVKIQNQGNSPQLYNLIWQDRAVELDFKPPNAQVQVPEGNVAYAEFRASPRQRRLIGGDQTHPITVQVANAAGVAQTHNGEVVSRGLIPIWLPPLAMVLCLALFAAAIIFIPPMVVRPTQTQVAMLATQTAAAATQWALADSDNDGLPNAEEIKLGTDPNKADTDGDGLADGDEVKKYGTNPLDIDTDHDSVNDGTEVAKSCSPVNPDSNGNGVPDNVDTGPCNKLIYTPTPTVTPTPTMTPTPTPAPYIACPGLYQSRLHVGDFAFVSDNPPVANRVREKHSTDAKILGFIQPGEKIEILEGPFCGDWIWWRVRSMKTGLYGWTSEGDNAGYWLVPFSK